MKGSVYRRYRRATGRSIDRSIARSITRKPSGHVRPAFRSFHQHSKGEHSEARGSTFGVKKHIGDEGGKRLSEKRWSNIIIIIIIMSRPDESSLTYNGAHSFSQRNFFFHLPVLVELKRKVLIDATYVTETVQLISEFRELHQLPKSSCSSKYSFSLPLADVARSRSSHPHHHLRATSLSQRYVAVLPSSLLLVRSHDECAKWRIDEVWFGGLFSRTDVFARRKKYNTPVYQSRHPGLNEYIAGIVKAACAEISKVAPLSPTLRPPFLTSSPSPSDKSQHCSHLFSDCTSPLSVFRFSFLPTEFSPTCRRPDQR